MTSDSTFPELPKWFYILLAALILAGFILAVYGVYWLFVHVKFIIQ